MVRIGSAVINFNMRCIETEAETHEEDIKER